MKKDIKKTVNLSISSGIIFRNLVGYSRFIMKIIIHRYHSLTWLMSLLFCFINSIQLMAHSPSDTLRINEFMALNQTTLMDEDGESSDWIEIYNATSSPINLQSWSLTDDKASLQKWPFPQVTLEVNAYLILFASGKDRRIPGEELHTNFNLSGDGEYLALSDPQGNIATEFDPSYPQQVVDVSYGFYDNDYIPFTNPTPGEANQFSEHQLLPPPLFSKERGYYESPFEVEITTDLQNAQIFYTSDGSKPTTGNGEVYSNPVQINTTTVLRAITVKSGQMTSKITTQTFLFLDDVINQPNNPPGYPSEWGPYTAIPGTAIADYEMDPEITQDPEYQDIMKDGLLSIPTLSIATNKDNLFSKVEDPDSGGIYIYTGPPVGNIPGDGWERPASVEFFNADRSKEFQVDCGIRLQGGHSRLAEKSAKHSLRLVFKSKYGPTKLNYPLFGEDAADNFNTITLRAGFGNTWNHWKHQERIRSQYIRDVWAKDTQLAMGQPSGHGRYVHLYINGIYWGIYNPTERIDREFGASYLGGDDGDFDVIKDYTSVVDGEITAWQQMMNMANAGLKSDENYQRIQGNNPDGTPNSDYEPYVDVVNLIDYMILNFYGGNWDWDHHNWIAVRNRINPGKGFRFFSWDAEHILESVSANELGENNPNCPSRLFQRLRDNANFRRLFGDRIQLHCFNGGVLTPEAAKERWMKRANEIDLAVIAESARWGDYRRDVHPYHPQGPFHLYTKNDHWQSEQDYLLNDYFQNRTETFVNQLRQANLFPRVSAPNFLINGSQITDNTIESGDVLTMIASISTSVIYYTTDSSDPFLTESSQADEQTVLIGESADKRVLVPKADIGYTWRTDLNFDDSGWRFCSGAPGGIGYEKSSGYENLITLDVGEDMHNDGVNPNPSCYVRIKFDVTKNDLSSYHEMTLGVLYDDGFVLYLNNKKVAEANAPTSPLWNSTSDGSHEADALESFNISEYIDDLIEGTNLLTIQAMNQNTSSTDFIINVNLKVSKEDGANDNVSPNAMVYSGPITLNQSTHIKARTLNNNRWSALNDVIFVIPSDIGNLKVTEIHYHPLAEGTIDDRSFEFIELKNVGTSPLDLSGVQFCNGILYSFPIRAILKANEFIVLASNQVQFTNRYGYESFGEYDGFLDNGGERVILVDVTNDTLFSVRYNDRDPWPVSADGQGYSIVPKVNNPSGDQSDPTSWRASYHIHGSPGEDDEASTIVETNLDGRPDIFQLDQNYPNPFNPTTRISYSIPGAAFVTLKIYDILGREIQTLVSEYQYTGSYAIGFDASDLASGIYFYRLKAGDDFVKTKKMLLMR